MRELSPTCGKGHSDWYIKADGTRTCRPCKNIRNRVARGGNAPTVTWAEQKSDKGEVESTFTRSEVLRARGYDV